MQTPRCKKKDSVYVMIKFLVILHVPFLTIRHLFTSYNVVALHCVILYCTNGWHVKDGVVHHSHQQWLVAKRLGGGVTVGVRVRARVGECNYRIAGNIGDL